MACLVKRENSIIDITSRSTSLLGHPPYPDSLPSPSIVHAHTLSLSSANSLESSTSSLNRPWPSCSTCTYLPDICLKWWLLFLSRSIYLGALTQDSCSLLMVTYYPLESICLPSFFRNPHFLKLITYYYSTQHSLIALVY